MFENNNTNRYSKKSMSNIKCPASYRDVGIFKHCIKNVTNFLFVRLVPLVYCLFVQATRGQKPNAVLEQMSNTYHSL